MATDKQLETLTKEYVKLDTKNASVVLTLTFALLRDQEKLAARHNDSIPTS